VSVQEHERALRLAVQTGSHLQTLFNRLGNEAHPRGVILRAYRAALAALRRDLGRVWLVEDVLALLEGSLAGAIRALLDEAYTGGVAQATREVPVYGLLPMPDENRDAGAVATEAALAVYRAQAAAVRTAVQLGDPDPEVLLGGDDRAGVLAPGAVIRETARLATGLALAGYSGTIDQTLAANGATGDFKKQAIAALDARTTDCCRRVHGQVVGLNEQFRLTGTPRFAGRMRAPPFHWYCRSTLALVRAEDVDDALTAAMLAGGRSATPIGARP
jgi:hypothetical protein